MTETTAGPRIGLWLKDNKGNHRPALTGNIEWADGTKTKVSLWRNSRNKYSGGPTFSGTLEVHTQGSDDE